MLTLSEKCEVNFPPFTKHPAASALLTRHFTFNTSTVLILAVVINIFMHVKHLATGNYDLSTLHLVLHVCFMLNVCTLFHGNT